MQSLAYIPGSNGAGNASQMTVQNVRAPGASDILVNTVTGVSTKFYGSMGEPHTFTDPVTGESITIISEATAVDFAGHVDSGKLVIDAIAPGYVDTRGSLVGDIVVIRPVTEWANNIFNVLSQAHNDNGTLKTGAADRALNAPQGFLINGKITRSVATNALTVAIKTLAGTDPSTTDPVYVRIGDTVRSITGALNLTLAAGTNWFGMGASFFVSTDQDFFTYLIWNTNTSAVVLGVAKEPDMRVFSDRNATTTAYDHLAITGTAPASTDEVEVVGRFNATLGATATFNWSLPATAIIVNRPIFETRVLSYTNNGNAAGTVYYQQKGSNKELWGVTPNALLNGATVSLAINLPAGYLSASLQSVLAQVINMTGNANIECYIAGASTSTVNVYLAGKAAGNTAGFGFTFKGI